MPRIVLQDLSKNYLLRAGFIDRLGQALAVMPSGIMRAVGHRLARAHADRLIPALHPLSATIEAGESVAILGRNGSGKSTLLSIIANVLSPSGGVCSIDGRVASILELGSGFHPDFTGRDNLRHKAALQGIAPRRLNERMDEILSFADIGEFIDEPISTYSTGMQMRLAFALNTVLDPEILIIDEALAVGDTFFQARCIRWIEDFISRGRIFLCVSHDIFTVRKLCHRGLVLERGRLLCDAPIGEAANTYYEVHRGGPQTLSVPSPASTGAADKATDDAPDRHWHPVSLRAELRTGNRAVELLEVETRPALDQAFAVGDELAVRLRLRANEAVANHHFGFGLRDKRGLLFGGFHTFYAGEPARPLEAGEEVEAAFTLQLALPPGEYLLLVGVGETFSDSDWADFDVCWDAAVITVLGPSRFWGLAELPYRDVVITQDGAPPPVPENPVRTLPA
jgi:lipopolysaccharide transport system ATP-binding protein